jgi:hypothetical protein
MLDSKGCAPLDAPHFPKTQIHINGCPKKIQLIQKMQRVLGRGTHKSRLFGNRWLPQTTCADRVPPDVQAIFCPRRHQPRGPAARQDETVRQVQPANDYRR